MGDVGLAKSKYLDPNANISTEITAIATILTTFTTIAATKGKAMSINSTATAAIKTKRIKAKILGYIETVWN